jgi:hypothetical protein
MTIRTFIASLSLTLLSGCASAIDCCSEFRLDAATLLGPSGIDCPTSCTARE